MVTKPTPGGSDGTYGTELNAFLDESLAADGKIKDGAVLEAATEVADGDRTVADKAYADNGGQRAVDGTPTAVFTKFFTGTLDAASTKNIAHSITGVDNILHVSIAVFDSNSSVYRTASIFEGTNADKKVTSHKRLEISFGKF